MITQLIWKLACSIERVKIENSKFYGDKQLCNCPKQSQHKVAEIHSGGILQAEEVLSIPAPTANCIFQETSSATGELL